MKNRLDVSELRAIQLEILDCVHAFCRSRGIRYSLCGGTLLGAVRHSGYIPWDDDIDLMMPRSDYERFKAEFEDENNVIVDMSREESCSEQFIKVYRQGTCMEDSKFHRRLFGVFIDIFPIDGMPEDCQEAYIGKLIALHQKVVAGFKYYKTATHHKFYWTIRYYLKKLFRNVPSNILDMKLELEAEALRHLPEASPLSTVIFGDFRVFPFESKMFFDLGEIDFEGRKYSCIKDTDCYLRTVYGDYMQLPPIEKRISHHQYDAYIEN